MGTAFHAGAVLMQRTSHSLNVEHAENDHVVLASPAFQLVILKVPEHVAPSLEIESPPRRRTETPIKLVFEVPSISAARAIAHLHGGELFPQCFDGGCWNSKADQSSTCWKARFGYEFARFEDSNG